MNLVLVLIYLALMDLALLKKLVNLNQENQQNYSLITIKNLL